MAPTPRAAQALRAIANHDLPPPPRVLGLRRRGLPFRDAEECIIWTIKALGRVAEGAAADASEPKRVCEPIEVVKCLDTLYRRRRIDLRHARILRIWGHRGRAPDAASSCERADWRLWREALDRLDWPLRSLGIIS
jgi:hypothetical protein